MSQESFLKSASYLSVIVAALILAVKLYGWLTTGSSAVLASLTDSLFDISASLINLIAIHIALIPPDDNHRFGHNKVQDLAVFGQSVLFLASGSFSLVTATKNLITNQKISDYQVGIKVMLISMLLNTILICYQQFVISKTNSAIIKADKLHYAVDFMTNLAVIFSIYASKYWSVMDSVLAVAISLYIIFTSYKLLNKSLKNLLDEEFNVQDKNKVLTILGSFPDIKGVHELKTRYAGDKSFIQFHIELDGNMSLLAAHEISENIINELSVAFPNSEIIVHQDPFGIEEDVKYRESL